MQGKKSPLVAGVFNAGADSDVSADRGRRAVFVQRQRRPLSERSSPAFRCNTIRRLLNDTKGLLAALKNSLILAGISCGISMVIGTLGAVGHVGA